MLASQLKISFSEWLPYGIPVVILLLISMILSLLLVLRPNFKVEFETTVEEIPLTKQRTAPLNIACVAIIGGLSYFFWMTWR